MEVKYIKIGQHIVLKDDILSVVRLKNVENDQYPYRFKIISKSDKNSNLESWYAHEHTLNNELRYIEKKLGTHSLESDEYAQNIKNLYYELNELKNSVNRALRKATKGNKKE